MSQLQHDYLNVFQGYDGTVSDENKVESVQLQLRNNKQPHHDAMLKIRNVLYKPSAPDTLLSLDQLEHDG